MAQDVSARAGRIAFRTGFSFAATLFLFGNSLSVQAEAGQFSIEPLYHEVVMGQDDTEKKLEIILSNKTSVDATFQLSVVDFGSLDESGGVAFLGGDSDFEKRYGLASWISLENEQLTLPAGEIQRVPVAIRNRESLSPGGHYGAVIFQTKAAKPTAIESPNVPIDSSFATLIFVKKTGGEIEDLAFREVESGDSDWIGIPTKAVVRFQNKGNIHLVPRGRVTVFDPFGRVVRKGVINEESGRILPESYRKYAVPLAPVSRAVFPGNYSLSVEYRYDGREAMEIVEQKTTFFSWKLAVVWGVLLVPVILTIFRFRGLIAKKSGEGLSV